MALQMVAYFVRHYTDTSPVATSTLHKLFYKPGVVDQQSSPGPDGSHGIRNAAGLYVEVLAQTGNGHDAFHRGFRFAIRTECIQAGWCVTTVVAVQRTIELNLGYLLASKYSHHRS